MMSATPTAQVAPTATGTTAAGSVRGRAPATQRLRRALGTNEQPATPLPSVAMPDLVALALPGGDGFVRRLQRTWDDGDAAFPVDLRLPPPARRAVLAAMAPARLVDENGDVC